MKLSGQASTARAGGKNRRRRKRKGRNSAQVGTVGTWISTQIGICVPDHPINHVVCTPPIALSLSPFKCSTYVPIAHATGLFQVTGAKVPTRVRSAGRKKGIYIALY